MYSINGNTKKITKVFKLSKSVKYSIKISAVKTFVRHCGDEMYGLLSVLCLCIILYTNILDKKFKFIPFFIKLKSGSVHCGNEFLSIYTDSTFPVNLLNWSFASV